MALEMTLRQKIGQLIFAGLPSEKPEEEFIRLIEEYKVGNVILFSRNIRSAHQTYQLCGDLQDLISRSAGVQAFIAIDQEGGMVTRLSGDCTNMPGAMAIAATGKPENAYMAGRITGRELRALGVNIDLAPVADVNSNPENPVIGVRSYGDDPGSVSVFVEQMARGLADSGVLPVLKHFPGHGDTSVDSHLALPRVDKTLAELEETELLPFRRAISGGAEAVLTSHILYPRIGLENLPATMSRAIITGLLRERMGFRGLVLSDCLEMNAIKDCFGTARGALEAIKAGVDMVFISHSAGLIKETVKLLEEAAAAGELGMDRLDEAVSRILKFKSKYADCGVEGKNLSGDEEKCLSDIDISIVGCPAHREEAERISAESITLVRCKPEQLPLPREGVLFVGCYASHITNVMSPISRDFNFPEYMARKLGGEALLINTLPQPGDMERVLSAAKGMAAVVFGTYNGHLFKGQLEILDRLCVEHDNVIAVALRNPYDIRFMDRCHTALAAFEYTPLSLDTLARVLKCETAACGKIPVKI